MKKEMLINVLQPEECRIAILEDGVLEELYVERTSHESYVGNIYKGRIVNIEPSIQAAFVDFGVGRNGFLHVSDVEPAYYRHLEGRAAATVASRGAGPRTTDRRDGRRTSMSRGLDESLAPRRATAATLLPDEAALEAQSAEEVVRNHRARSRTRRAPNSVDEEPVDGSLGRADRPLKLPPRSR